MPIVVRFKEWVVAEVLPAIRKHREHETKEKYVKVNGNFKGNVHILGERVNIVQ